MKGRPPKPIELHILEGTFDKRRHSGAADVAATPSEELKPPRWLDREARAAWRQFEPKLRELGILGALDGFALALLCDWWARYRRFAKRLDADTGKNPTRTAKLLTLASVAWGNFDKIAARFGLTPSDRQRLRVAKPAKKAGVMTRRRDPQPLDHAAAEAKEQPEC